MHSKLNGGSRKALFRFMVGVFAFFFSFGVSVIPVAHAQEAGAQKTGKYYTVTPMTLSDGTLVDEVIINGPPAPPPGFEIERQAVSLPEPDIAAGVNILTVPAFNWVFGCSSVSGAMIAGYYDRTGYSNIYTGPTNGGVMPMNNSSWPTWSDGVTTYPNCPLIASHNGVDGRATKGSIDDYWVQYDSAADDPYITGSWTQHTWGDAIGDYMKTSQSAFGNTDGSTAFYNYTSSASPLTCAAMLSVGISTFDGTYGRKLFYEAGGYAVTDCYNQKTDNTVSGGFSFAQFKAEIDAGRPVMLNLAGHTVVGVGYDDSSSLVYIHDTWDYDNHTMTWGTTYMGMGLLSVSIVNLQAGAFTFTDQTNAELSTVTTSNTIGVSWISVPAAISITGGTYSINGGGYTSASGTVSDGDTVTVRQTSSGSYSTTTDAELTIGVFSDTFSVTTKALAGAELIADGSFEGGSPSVSWSEASTNFGTPLCDDETCGGAGARTGTWWAWFGGVKASEIGSVSQGITIPNGSAELKFYLEIPASSGNGTDFLKVKIDGNEIFSVLESAAAIYAAYTLVTIDISAYADGAAHVLSFESTITGTPDITNFFVDDVSVVPTNFAVLRLSGSVEPYTESWYSNIQDAFNDSSDTDDILTWASNFVENLNFDRENISITFNGGYNEEAFDHVAGVTTIQGSLTISRGAVMIDNFIIK